MEAAMSFSTPAKSAFTVLEIISARIGMAIAISRPTSTYLADMTFLTSSKYSLSSTSTIFYLFKHKEKQKICERIKIGKSKESQKQ
jgi:hypothetical protein